MGLSRKLGGGASPRAELPPESVTYTWSTQSYTLREILARFQLPCVVQCAGDAEPVLWTDFTFNVSQPLLLLEARTVRKIHARSLTAGSQPGELEEFGPPLAIPEDYDGWFFPVSKKDPNEITQHTRLQSVASTPNCRFLVTTPVNAFTPMQTPNTGTRLEPHEVSAGEVLTKIGVVKCDPVGTSGFLPALSVQRGLQQCMKCLDENRQDVVIPFNQQALLYDVAENYGNLSGTSGNTKLSRREVDEIHATYVPGVVSTHTLISAGNAHLPRVFRHVLGELPLLTHAFTGLLRCYSIFTEETVMASTMSRKNLSSVFEMPSCLELGTDSSAKFNIALNAAELRRTNQYAAALKICEEQAPSYVRSIKVSFTVHPVTCDLSDENMSVQDRRGSTVRVDVTSKNLSVESRNASAKTLADRLQNVLAGSLHDSSQETTAGSAGVESPCASATNHAISSPQIQGSSAISETPKSEIQDVSVNSYTDRAQQTLERDSEHDGGVFMDNLKDSENMVDVASISDVPDSVCESFDGASLSDVVEIDAMSEFDISWNQERRRARSFSGSISSADSDRSDGSDSDNSESSREDNSIVSQDSVIKRAETINAHLEQALATFGTCEKSSSVQISSVSVCKSDTIGYTDYSIKPTNSDIITQSESNINQDYRPEVMKVEDSDKSLHKISCSEVQKIELDGKKPNDVGEGKLCSEHTYSEHTRSLSKTKPVPPTRNQSLMGQVNKQMNSGMDCDGKQLENSPGTSLDISKKNELGDKKTAATDLTFSYPDTSVLPEPYHSHEQSHSLTNSGIMATHDQLTNCIIHNEPKHFHSNLKADGKEDEKKPVQHETEFVKSLGEKLLGVSKWSTTPKYKRMDSNQDKDIDSEVKNKHLQGRRQSHSTFDWSVRSATDDDDRVIIVDDTSFDTDSDSEPPNPLSGILDDLDLLHEEIV